MNNEDESLENKYSKTLLNKILYNHLSNFLCSRSLKMFELFDKYLSKNNNSHHQIRQLIDEILKLCTMKDLTTISKQKYDESQILSQFLAVDHQKQHKITGQNLQYFQAARVVFDGAFNKLVHHTSVKQLPELTIIFYQIVAWQMFNVKTINHFLMVLILEYQNLQNMVKNSKSDHVSISNEENVKIMLYGATKSIRQCLIRLYSKKLILIGSFTKKQQIHINKHLFQQNYRELLIFSNIVCIIYIGNPISTKPLIKETSQQTEIINKIMSDPIFLVSQILYFRNQYQVQTSEQFRLKCCRNDNNLYSYVVDNYLMKGLLGPYLDFTLNEEQKYNIFNVIKNLLSFNLNVLTIKSVIRKLEITSVQNIQTRWNQIFTILKSTLPKNIISSAQSLFKIQAVENLNKSPKKQDEESVSELQLVYEYQSTKFNQERQVLSLKKTSYFKINIDQQFTGFRMNFRSSVVNLQHKQYAFFQFSNDDNQYIYVTINETQTFSIYEVLVCKVSKNKDRVQNEQHSLQLIHKPFQTLYLKCNLIGQKISLQFGKANQDFEQKLDFFISNIECSNIKEPSVLTIGFLENKKIPNYCCEIVSFIIFKKQQKQFDFIQSETLLKKSSKRGVILKKKFSLSYILKLIGDLDLFFIIVSHLIRKVSSEKELQQSLKQILSFLQVIVVAKGVFGVKLTQQIKQQRLLSTKCLIWMACKYKRDIDSIFQLFRLLSIRGMKRPSDSLEILCNLSLWKDFSWQSHLKVIQKIKQTCNEFIFTSNGDICSFMKKIILDLTLFYKNVQTYCESTQQQFYIKHSQVLKLAYDCVISKNTEMIIEFINFLLKVLHQILTKGDCIDTTLSYQITQLAFRLIFQVRQSQYNSAISRNKIYSPHSPLRKVKTAKSGLMTSKSMNTKVFQQRNQQFLLLKIKQLHSWIKEIIKCVSSQILSESGTIKYYDWDWNQSTSTSNSSIFSTNRNRMDLFGRKFKTVKQIQLKTMCEKLEVSLASYNRNSYISLAPKEPSFKWLELFWQLNLFNDKISLQRVIETIKYAPLSKIVWNDQKVLKLTEKSFEILQLSSSQKLPSNLLEMMQTENINLVHNNLYAIYLNICQQNDPIRKTKYSQNIMYIISMLPNSLYSNTQLLREELKKQKRNLSDLDNINMHLVLKQLAYEGFKMINAIKKQNKKNELQKQELAASTIFTEIQLPQNFTNKSQSNSKIQTQPDIDQRQQKKSQNDKLRVLDVQYSSSFFMPNDQKVESIVSNQLIVQKLKFCDLYVYSVNMEEFLKKQNLISNQQVNNQIIESNVQIFKINISQIVDIFSNETSQLEKLNKFQNYLHFLNIQILGFTKCLLNKHIFQKQIQRFVDVPKKNKTENITSIKSLKCEQDASLIFQEFLKERRKSIYRMSKVWQNIQKNNKDVWQIFLKFYSKHQSVDPTCNSLKMRSLTKSDNNKRQIQLPKNLTICSTGRISLSAESQKQLIKEHSESQGNIFEQVNLYNMQEENEKDKQDSIIKLSYDVISKDKKAKQFPVLYITITTIYQGTIYCEQDRMTFIQNQTIDENLYSLICANQHERRSQIAIQKETEEFTIFLNENSTIISKRYLYMDNSFEVFSQNSSYFFVFRRSSNKQSFFKLYSHLKGTISNVNQIIQQAQKQMQRWINGDISNFTYLMHLNDLSGRSLNDMSQYYIFPWILKNYKSQKFNRRFINNADNYRDLSKPIGAINKQRLSQLTDRFQQSQKYSQTESYLYGSYCSNPAIVCNFLVRLQPFSLHHYLLQSKQFDLADRLFYSIENQFACCYNNIGDYKELIPEFYCYPEFLRNRNKYIFGETQDKKKVVDVELPLWALYQYENYRGYYGKGDVRNYKSLNPEKFVFKMRKCLESNVVTRSLNSWINLIFGVYGKRQRAMQKQNLYISTVYKKENTKHKESQNISMFYKQFGEMPRCIFEKNHRMYHNNIKTYYKLENSEVSHIKSLQTEPKGFYSDEKYFINWNQKVISIMEIKNEQFTQVQNNQNISGLKVISLQDSTSDSKKVQVMLYLKKGKLYLRQISFSTFRKKLQIKDQKIVPLRISSATELIQIDIQHQLLILVDGTIIKFYKYSLITNQQNGNTQTNDITNLQLTKKSQLRFTLKYEFTQHNTKIYQIYFVQSYQMLLSIDINRKVNILKINSKQYEINQHFRLKKLSNCEAIRQIKVHQMGFFFILTSLNRIHMYNFMGDHVSVFSSETLEFINSKMQKNVRKAEQFQDNRANNLIPNRKAQENRVQRLHSLQLQESDRDSYIPEEVPSQLKVNYSKQKKESKQQEIEYFQIWNNELSELIIGTNKLGTIYKINIFMLDDCEKISLVNCDIITKKSDKRKKSGDFLSENDCQFKFMKVNRIGRHWQFWVAISNQVYKIQSQEFKNSQKRQQQYRKKHVLF